MIDSLKIMDALSKLAFESVPELEEIYTDLVPGKPKRPSLLIQAVTTSDRSANIRLVEETQYFTMTVFDKTDDYDRSSTKGLLALQNKLLHALRKGYILVPDGGKKPRALRVQASGGGRDWDKAYVDLQLTFYDRRDETPDTTPLMESIETKMTTKE